MKRNEIRINRLEVRLKNGDLGRARELRATLGGDLLQQIAERTNAPLNRGSIKIDRVEAHSVFRRKAVNEIHGISSQRRTYRIWQRFPWAAAQRNSFSIQP